MQRPTADDEPAAAPAGILDVLTCAGAHRLARHRPVLHARLHAVADLHARHEVDEVSVMALAMRMRFTAMQI